MPKHPIPSDFRRRQVTIDLVGCGGTGSRLLPMLADLDLALKQLGHPGGLQIAVYDPDVVTTPSVGRTLFTASDIGQHKVSLAVERVNFVYGTHYHPFPHRYSYGAWNMARAGAMPDIVITCTDSLRSRVQIAREMMVGGRMPPRYWIDCGNDADTGQVIMGEIDGHVGRNVPPLRTVMDLFPDMEERAELEEEEPDSCTLAEALSFQGLNINRHLATWAAELLWRLFRDGGLDYHGVFLNTKTGRVNPLLIDPAPMPAAAPAEVAAPRRRRTLRARHGRPQMSATGRQTGRKVRAL